MSGIKEFFKKYKTIAEFIKYSLVSLFTKFVNIVGEALTRFIFEPAAYASFASLIWGASKSVVVSVVSTTVGFLSASAVEFVLSVLFVFGKDKRGNSVGGFFLFMLLSLGGLGIHILCKYLGENVWGFPWLAVNLVGGCFVLAYNYIVKKLVLFTRKKKNQDKNVSAE